MTTLSTALKTTRRRFLVTLALAATLLALPGAGLAQAQTNDGANQVLQLVNAERARAGLSPLVLNAQLNQAAAAYAQVLATSGCFAHTCGPVPNMTQRAEQAGYTNWTGLGENIAGGQRTPEAVVAGWMSSPGHRANLLDATYQEMGVGVATGGQYGIYWAQMFGVQVGGVPRSVAAPAPAQPAFQPLPSVGSLPAEQPAADPQLPVLPAEFSEPEVQSESAFLAIDQWWPDASWAPDEAAAELWYWDPTVGAWTYFDAAWNNWVFLDPAAGVWMVWSEAAGMWVPMGQ